MTECVPDSLSILGTPVSVFESADDVVQLIRRRILLRRPTFCVAINPEKVYRAKHDPRLSQVLDFANVRICDGVGISLASRLLYGKRLARCTGIDLFMNLVRLAAREKWKVYLLGASPQVNEAASLELARTIPGLVIAGRQHGYFQNSAEVVENINESGADLLFVAMGSPRQEFWIREHMATLKTTFCMGVGGSLDVVSGAVKRAPAFYRKTGTEWLFRLVSEPSRLRRQAALPLFTLDILRAVIHH